jgi:hypothetical protein
MKVAVIGNDVQFPFHDEKCLNLFETVIEDIKPDKVILLGDVTDCHEISDFMHDPLDRADLLLEQKLACNLMARISKVCKDNEWMEGNHEFRLTRYVCNKAPALRVLSELTFEQLFHLKEYGFKHSDYGDWGRLGKLLYTHGYIVRSGSGASARAHYQHVLRSLIIGHTQRFGAYYHTALGEMHVAYENACLCKLNPKWTQNPDWQQGFSIVHYDDNGLFNVQQIPIMKYRNKAICYYGRERYQI